MSSPTHNQPPTESAPITAPPAEWAGLLQSGHLAQRIVDCLQEGILVFDRELRCRVWNPFMEKITGQPAGEVLGQRAAELSGFVKERGLDALLERALAGHNALVADTAFAQKRTQWAGHLAGHLTPLRNDQGQIVGVAGVIQDISRRKRMEEAHLAHEQRYRQLFDENPQPMWVLDVETRAFLAVNEAAIRHYGYTREEFLFMTLEGILAPADEPASARDNSGQRGGAEDAPLWKHQTKDGRIIDVEISSHVVNFGGRRAVLVAADDVTERLKAQQTLRENELKYRTLIEAADIAIFLSEAETGRIVETNRRAETLLGLPRHKIVGLHLQELSPPELTAARRTPAARPALPFSSAAPQAYVWHRAGRRIPVDIISSVIEVGGQRMLQSIYRDVTERRRAEEALSRRTRQLEVLSRANRQLHAVLEIPAVLRTLVSTALELVRVSGGMAGIVLDGKLTFNEYQLRGKTSPVNHQFESGQGVAGYVVSSKLTYCSNDPRRDPLVIPEIQSTYQLYNLVCVPILSREGEVLGCLEVHNTEDHRPIEDTDLTMLEVLAASAAIAIENTWILSQHAALLESVPDGILVVDEGGKMVGFNQHFARMWKIPKAILGSRQDEQALEHVLTQIKDPQAFLEKVKRLYHTPDAESHDHVEFKDGRVFERFSSPRRVGGRPAGRVWSFRDVTTQFRAKAARSQQRADRRKSR
jgi:PAS domain S-box-containing protein